MSSEKYTIDNPMAPLWIKYPQIGCGSIGWRWGSGEEYKFKFFDWFNMLSENDREKYKELFPKPKIWDDFYNDGDDYKEEYFNHITPYWNKDGKPEYSLKDLIKEYNSGNRIKYIFFWGHQPSKTGELTKSCFSQWWKCNFSDDDGDYNCAEQYMMSKKALLFGDIDIYKEIMKSKHPKEIKALGRKIRNFSEDVWNEEKYSIVLNGNYAKFSQNKELRDYLIETKNRVIAEASPYDNIWGIKMSTDNPKVENPIAWKGQNLLGFALMEVRNELNRVYKNIDKINLNGGE